MSVRLSDLPKHVRDRIEADQPKRKGAAKGGGSTSFDGWCFTCRERITSGAAMERHRDETGHARFQCWPEPTEGAAG